MRVVLSVVGSFALMTVGLIAAPSSASPAEPVIAQADMDWHDGLNHFILTPDTTIGAAVGVAVGTTDGSAGQATLPATTSSEDATDLPAGAILTHTPDGQAMALLTDGRLVSLDQLSQAPVAPATPVITDPAVPRPPLVGGSEGRGLSETFAAQVKEWAGASSTVKPLGGGLISIATSLSRDEVTKHVGVARIDDDVLLQLTSVTTGRPNDAMFDDQWMLDNTGAASQASGYAGVADADVDAPDSWAYSTGANTVVAVLDSGVEITHPDLAGNIWHNTADVCGNAIDDDHNGYVDDCNGWDAGDNDNNPAPSGSGSFNMHGTHVAGIVAARTDNTIGIAGTAPNAKVMAVKLATNGNLSTSAILSGTMYAVDNGADVINASFGTDPGTTRAAATIMEQAVQYAQSHGVLFIAAAGNSGTDIDTAPVWPASYSQYYDNVITVGASTNEDTKASFSNYGSASVDVFAPGWFILSTVPGSSYSSMSGTSMAAPVVSGAVAILASAEPTWTPAQLKTQLRNTVDHVPDLAGYSATSRINVASAIGAPTEPFSVQFADIHDVTQDTPFTATATIKVADGNLMANPTNLQATLVTSERGYVFAVGGWQAQVGIGSTTTTATTNSSGVATLGVLSAGNLVTAETTSGLDVTLTGSLPVGYYGLLVQPTDSNGNALTNGSVVYFGVGMTTTGDDSSSSGGSTGGSDGGTGTGGSNGGTGPGGSTGGSTDPGTVVSDPDTNGSTTDGSSGNTGGSGTTTTGGGSSGSGNTGGTSGGTATSDSDSNNDNGTPVQGDSTSGNTTTPGGTPSGGGSAPTPVDPGDTENGTLDSSNPTAISPVTDGGWTLSSVWPRTSSTSGGTIVMLGGNFPDDDNATVVIGGISANIVQSMPTTLWAIAPAHVAGTVNISVHGPGGETLTIADIFTYVDTTSNGGGSSGGSSTGGSSDGDTSSDGSNSTNGDDSSGGSSNDSGDTGNGTNPVTVVPGGSSNSDDTTLPTTVKRGNLTLHLISSATPLTTMSATAWPGRLCTTASCSGIPLRS